MSNSTYMSTLTELLFYVFTAGWTYDDTPPKYVVTQAGSLVHL